MVEKGREEDRRACAEAVAVPEELTGRAGIEELPVGVRRRLGALDKVALKFGRGHGTVHPKGRVINPEQVGIRIEVGDHVACIAG